MNIIYTVQSGDSLSKIARDKLGDMERWREVAYINSLSHPYIVHPGQIIQLPDDSSPLVIDITEGTGKPPVVDNPLVNNSLAAPALSAGFQLSPATVMVLLIGAALFFMSKGR